MHPDKVYISTIQIFYQIWRMPSVALILRFDVHKMKKVFLYGIVLSASNEIVYEGQINKERIELSGYIGKRKTK